MEKWKQVSYAPNYEVSDYGNVRSIKYKRLLSQKTKTNGYKEVCLYVNKKPIMNYVHRLVASEFIKELPKKHGLEVNHLDGHKDNNRLKNLQVVTPSENKKHSYHTLGNKIAIYRGSNNACSKLNESKVFNIRMDYSNGIKLKQLGEKYNVSKYTIYDVVKRKTWKHTL